MIEACLAINEYMQSAVSSASLTMGELYPGTYAPSTENSNSFCLYDINPNSNQELFPMKTDVITYSLYNSDFITLKRIAQVVDETFNVENIQDESLSETGIRFLETSVTFTGTGSASFVDGREYFLQHFAVYIKYTIEPVEDVGP